MEWHDSDEKKRMLISSVRAHARSIEAKDVYTAGHCGRVEQYSEILARQCDRFDEDWIFKLKVGALLHDIGKIGVPGAILKKPAALDQNEHAKIETHPDIGGRIVDSLYDMNLGPMVRHHHERWDGRGYPSKLKGEEIPLEARIILIADTFDAMTSNRPYRRALPTERALEELRQFSGAQFDPDLVDAMLAAGAALEAARSDMAENPGADYFPC